MEGGASSPPISMGSHGTDEAVPSIRQIYRGRLWEQALVDALVLGPSRRKHRFAPGHHNLHWQIAMGEQFSI